MHLPDFLALYAVVEIFGRFQDDEIFREVRPGLADRASFRHDMLTLGLANHFRLHTPYQVRLPSRSPTGERTPDLVIGDEPGLDVETKSSDQFDGPRRHVSDSNAFRGIQHAWRRAYGGQNPQLGDSRPSAILIGGVTMELECLTSIARVAHRWLERKGAAHPNCWGILAMTFLTYSRIPVDRAVGDGAPLTVDARAGVHLGAAVNSYYTGPVRLVLSEPEWWRNRDRT